MKKKIELQSPEEICEEDIDKKTTEINKEESNESDNSDHFTDESIYSLLDDDYSSGEEEVLGVSFNIPYQKQFIPGNKIHRQLAWYQGKFREVFYKKDKGIPRPNNSNKHLGENDTYDTYYEKIKQSIITEQESMKKVKSKKKEEFNSTAYKNYKSETLQKIIGKPYITTLKNGTDENRVYPNFGVAKLSYIKNKKMYSKCIVIPRETLDGHSEVQIFQQALIQIKSINLNNIDRIILDINTAMSMCKDCQKAMENFKEEIKNILKKDILTIRVGYNFPYNNEVSKNNMQVAIPFPEQPNESKSFYYESIAISSGYKGSKRQKEAIKKVDEYFVAELLISKFDSYHHKVREREITIPEGFQDVAHDGLCFYSAVAFLNDTYTATALRTQAIGHILQNLTHYQNFVQGLDLPIKGFADMLPMQAMEAYINYHMRHYDTDENTWADHLMIQAVADIIQVNIQIQMFNQQGEHQIYQNGDNQGQNINITFQAVGANNTLVIGNIANLHFVPAEDVTSELEHSVSVDENNTVEIDHLDIEMAEINLGGSYYSSIQE